VERFAGAKDKDGKLLAQESNLVWISPAPGARNASAVWGGLLENGKWHLLVFTWAWPTFSLSLDGAAPVTQSLSGLPDKAVVNPALFHLGTKGAPAATLMDEVLIFNRPLTTAETKLIYDTVTSWTKRHEAPVPPAVSATATTAPPAH
jgi:hypothetical protein